MKTTALTLITILTISVNVLFAGNDKEYMPATKETNTTFVNLAPVTPNEATFDEPSVSATSSRMEPNLAPVTPKVADLEMTEDLPVSLNNLAPVTPKEADFDEE